MNNIYHEKLIDNISDWVWAVNANGVYTYCSQNVYDFLGFHAKDVVGKTPFEFMTSKEAQRVGEILGAHVTKKEPIVRLENIYIHKDGSSVVVETSGIPILDDNGNLLGYQGLDRNITKEKNLERKIRHNAAFFESFKYAINESNIVSKSDLDGVITYVNDNFIKISGYTREELIGSLHNRVRHQDTDDSVFKDLWKTIKSKKTWKGIIKNKKKDGGYYWIDICISPILDENGEIFEYIAIRHDVTELVDQRRELENSAQTDTLTGLGNRFKLINDIKDENSPSLVLINIDNFREINDFYGHRFGDMVISDVAKKLIESNNAIEHGELYRVQGDIFAILNTDKNTHSFIAIIYNLVETLSSIDFIIDSEDISLQFTATISLEKDKTKLFTTADMMMHTAKREHKKLLVYDETLTLNKEYENNIKWTKKLKHAIKEDKLIPFYQPIVNNQNGNWEKYECLVRMVHEDGEVISPNFFLDIAKRTKNYIELTKTVIQKSFDTFKEMDVSFSINLTIQDIMDEDLKEFIFKKLQEYKIGHRVVFEIVESEGIENFDKVIEFIRMTKECGCKIAIDDFGTGYSNFEYLLKLKADYIKIDGSLIKNLDKDEEHRAVVSTIVDFAKKMGMKTIAEFVENKKIAEIVKTMGIDYSQGYYFSEPKAEPEIK